MLDLPGQPLLDKAQLIGACARLALRIDAARLRTEVQGLSATLWSAAGAGGRVGVHRAAEALFLRGYAPASGDLPIADREILAELPYCREIITHLVPAPVLRCLLARLPAGGYIAPHIDRAPYFSQSIRLHIPVETHRQAYMVCSGLCYSMAAGEVWALNNCARHAVWNAHAGLARTHLIADFLPSEALLGMLAGAERDLGVRVARVEQFFATGVG